ncbi:serine hydrolase domain-containing protein [Dongia deserti]|uniref:serine hydrolase domain-containing protein n=1 Tax=Dongia deserti TaxID=2268030 RepID=UPI0025479832|nr:serine hydrolase [Dongia deserti]
MNDSTQGAGVTLANWRQAPWNRWAFHHVPEVLPVMRIAHDPARVSVLPKAPRDIGALAFTGPDGAQRTTASLLPETATDGFLVLHKGRIAFEWYGNGLTPSDPHIVFSVSKSITGILAGILVERGQLDPDAPAARYIPEALGSAYGDCTVRHVLDMTVGIAFAEDYLDLTGDFARYRAATGWNPLDNPALAMDLRTFLVTLRRDANPHGAKFHYVSPNSDLLGWILERAGGLPYARLLTELLWSRLGTEADAHVTVDRLGAARSAGGICVALRDLARFGEMVRNFGRVGDQQIVPRRWIEDILQNGDQGAWLATETAARFLPQGRYRTQWYMIGNPSGAHCAVGIHGQWIYIDPVAEMVIAKLSSQPLPLDEATDHLLLAAFAAIADALRA